MDDKQKMIEEFESRLGSTGVENIQALIDFIRKSDFYTAPASTKYHSCHEGGLLEHSLNVMKCLIDKKNYALWSPFLEAIKDEDIILASLLHDICKCYYYRTELKNKKVYSETGSKIDANGRYDWQSVQGYTVEDRFPYGHGEKSVMMIEQFIHLDPVVRYAIRWHMGFTEPKENWSTIGEAIKRYPLVLALHEADLESTYLLEKEE